MTSIFRGITPAEIFTEIRMLRRKHKGAFFLMEGPHDFRRFAKFFNSESAAVIPCHGKGNVVGAIDLMQDIGLDDCLGFVDADFERIDGLSSANDDIILSDGHDFDIDICTSGVVPRYLEETAVAKKLDGVGGCAKLIQSLLEGLKPLSALRYANEKKGLGYKLSDINLESFFDGAVIDVGRMIEAVSGGKFSAPEHRADLAAHVGHYAGVEMDLRQFTNGHDLIAALGIALRDRVGSRHPAQTRRQEVEKHLRLAFDWADFHAIGLAAKVTAWQASRIGLQVLKQVA
jgi:hypothetical protein